MTRKKGLRAGPPPGARSAQGRLAYAQEASAGRQRKIEAELQRVLAELIAREVKDPRVGNVTITAVSLSADKAVAKIFYAPFASSHPREQVQSGLTRAAGFLRGEAGRRLGLRHAPRLDFVFDDTAEKAARLTGLIDRTVAQDSEKAND